MELLDLLHTWHVQAVDDQDLWDAASRLYEQVTPAVSSRNLSSFGRFRQGWWSPGLRLNSVTCTTKGFPSTKQTLPYTHQKFIKTRNTNVIVDPSFLLNNVESLLRWDSIVDKVYGVKCVFFFTPGSQSVERVQWVGHHRPVIGVPSTDLWMRAMEPLPLPPVSLDGFVSFEGSVTGPSDICRMTVPWNRYQTFLEIEEKNIGIFLKVETNIGFRFRENTG